MTEVLEPAQPVTDHTRGAGVDDLPGLGPDSATYRFFGDWRGLLMGLWSGSMQNMHPKLAAGVWEHSDFFGERWERLLRSVYPIGGVVFDPDPETTAHQVRDYHLTIKGQMDDGGRYHALDPDVFYWAHATFWYGNIRCAEAFGPKITEADKRRLFEESRTWYARYGVSMRPVPDTYEDFLEYWDHMCTRVLRDHAAVRTVLDITQLPPPPFLPSWTPRWLWKRMAVSGNKTFMWLTTGLYDEPIREMMGLTWSARDEKLFRLFGKTVDTLMKLVPPRYRRHPRARDADDRVAGRVPMDAPVLETPKRNLPSGAERDNPIHYCPVHAQRRGNLPWQSNEVDD
ncbi:oxygenase MpaB family protein [Gordonia sp. (in: high G+C Gram-positive bacteria)]|uniref:oxygenase MpaB family protein n=1 Tax=Gordonia sp. (in: high G+C Gram-positive bacteria) TaxID=84139 RepID=UPI0039E41BC0